MRIESCQIFENRILQFVRSRKRLELCHIFELLSVVGIELFTKLCNSKLKENKKACFEENILKIKRGISEYENLIKYCNNQLQDISVVFSLDFQKLLLE